MYFEKPNHIYFIKEQSKIHYGMKLNIYLFSPEWGEGQSITIWLLIIGNYALVNFLIFF